MACFFGFGSLVNTGTHKYEMLAPARVNGWARTWVHHDWYDHSLLSVTPEPGTHIHGLMARVPGDDWAELDLRENGYDRYMLREGEWQADTSLAPLAETDVQMYKHAHGGFAKPDKPILWSYLETVLFGYYQVFGSAGVEAFMATTRHWTDVLDDRKDPVYPRYVPVVGEMATAVVMPQIEGQNIVMTPRR
ncbi:MAG: hypothetical protein ACPGVP_10565 [Thiolinea sp.]